MRLRFISIACLLAFYHLGLATAGNGLAADKTTPASQTWVATWGTSPQPTSLARALNPSFHRARPCASSCARASAAIRFAFGFRMPLDADALVVGAAHIALRSERREIVEGTDRRTHLCRCFLNVRIAPGTLIVSDSVNLGVAGLSDLAVTIYLPGTTGQATWHVGAQGHELRVNARRFHRKCRYARRHGKRNPGSTW